MTGSAPVRHGLADGADAGVFLTRLTRFDPAALVRLRPAVATSPVADGVPAEPADAGPLVALWGRLPWGVLVTRAVPGSASGDITVEAAALAAALARGDDLLPPRRDGAWRWPLPPTPGSVIERIPAVEVARVARAAADALRTAAATGVGGRVVGERMVRDALLDHVAIVVTPRSEAVDVGALPGGVPQRVEVPQRLVQAVTRMGFLGAESGNRAECPEQTDVVPHGMDVAVRDIDVSVRVTPGWVALSAPYGTAWLRTANLLALRPASVHTNG